MWIIISTAIPVVLTFYGLSRLQHNRNNHGAQPPTCRTYTPAQFYSYENPNLHRQANTLQSAEEKDAEVRKYLVKWDSDEESEQNPAFLLSTDVDTADASDVMRPKQMDKRKGKQADVKWDAFEEE